MSKLTQNIAAIACFGKSVCEEVERRLDDEKALGKASDAAEMAAENAKARFTLLKNENTVRLNEIKEWAEQANPEAFRAYVESMNPFAAMMGGLGRQDEGSDVREMTLN